jgi:hypothetical protein
MAEFYHIRKQSIYQLENWEQYERDGNNEMKAIYKKFGDNIFRGVKSTVNRNQSAAVYTTIFGKYDKLRSIPQQSVNVDYICICDEIPDFENEEAAKQWHIVKVAKKPEYNNSRMQAKHYKLLPFEIVELIVYDNLIYIDASFKVINRQFVRFCLSSLTNKRFTLCKHPVRRMIKEEAYKSSLLAKYDGQRVLTQVEDYHFEGYNNQVSLFACGLMVRNNRSMPVRTVCKAWMMECINHTYQDQISLPYVCWKNNFIPDTFRESALYTTQYVNHLWRIYWNDL